MNLIPHKYLLIQACIISVLLGSVLAQAQPKYKSQNQLLWKISGNGLQKPSYVFGTMHVKDERVFRLSDSTLLALKSVDAFAGEVDLEDMVANMWRLMFDKDTVNYLRKYLPIEDYKYLAEKIESRVGYPVEDLNTQEPWLLEMFLAKVVYGGRSGGASKQTFLDSYLYYVSRQNAKQLRALERFSEYSEWDRRKGMEHRVRQLLENARSLESDTAGNEAQKLNALNDLYLAGDIEGLYKLLHQEGAKEFVLESLNYRNANMAFRIDSIIKTQTLFAAMGALHLPGDSGVIQLLRNKGYTVAPVKATFLNKSGLPKIKKDTLHTWVPLEVPESPFRVLMPVKYFKIPNDGGEYMVDMEEFAALDLSNMARYQAIFVKMGSSLETEDEVKKALDNISSLFVKKRKSAKVETKYIADSLLPRLEIFQYKGKRYEKSVVYVNKNGLLVLTARGDKDLIASKTVLKFMTSVTLGDFKEQKNRLIVTRFENFGISLLFPEHYKKVEKKLKINKEDDYYSARSTHYYNMSPLDGKVYELLVYQYYGSYYLQNRNRLEKRVLEELLETGKYKLDTYKDTLYTGMDSLVLFTYKHRKQDKRGVGMMLVRDNRLFVYMIGGTSKNLVKSDIMAQNMASFKFIPYLKTNYGTYTDPENRFSINLPPRVRIDTNNTQNHHGWGYLPNYDLHIINVFDEPISSVKYMVSYFPYAKYYRLQNGQAILDSIMANADDSTLVFKKTVKIGAYTCPDFISREEDGSVQRYRYFVTDHGLYYISAFAGLASLKDAVTDQVFNSFKILSPYKVARDTAVMQALVSDLASKDSTAAYLAYEALDYVKFGQRDLPLLHHALLVDYPFDGEKYTTVKQKIWEKIIKSDQIDYKPMVYDYYRDTSISVEKKVTLLKVIAKVCDDSIGGVMLRDLFVADPLKTDSLDLYGLAYYQMGSKLKYMLPEAYGLIDHPVYAGHFTLWLASLLDEDTLDRKAEIVPMASKLEAEVQKQLANAQDHKTWVYVPSVVIRLLGKLGTTESRAILHQLVQDKNLYVKSIAVQELLQLKEILKGKQVSPLLEDLEYRIATYAVLERNQCLHLCPAKYAKQKALAQAHIYEYLYRNDYEVDRSSIKVVHTQVLERDSVRNRVYLVKYKLLGDNKWYVAMSGYHPVDTRIISTRLDVAITRNYELGVLKPEEHIIVLDDAFYEVD